MNYCDLRKYDISNTSGISTTLFVSGCIHKCKGCFNEVAQDFNYGEVFTKEIENLFIEYAKDRNVKCVAILGGEVFQQDKKEILNLFRRIKDEVKKPLWVWTGYTYEELLKEEINLSLLENIDILIDGRFKLKLKDLSLKHRGSSNQRVIDVQESLKENKVILSKYD